KALSMGKILLMGRKTWDSIGKPLPDRDNWVLSRDASFKPQGAQRFDNLDTALRAAGDRDLIIMGGAEIYRQALPHAHRIELTRVHTKVASGDTWFPELDASQWRETVREDHPADDRHAHAYSFITLDRRV